MSKIARHRLWLCGQWQTSNESKDVFYPFNKDKVATVDQASAAQLELALQAAHDSFLKFRKMSRYMRAKLCLAMASGIAKRKEEFVHLLVYEAGKPYKLSDVEVERAITSFTLAAEEAKRLTGEMSAVDLDAASIHYTLAGSQYVPRGPVLGISPFNFPLNLVAHKVAPALACGTSILLKPPPQAPGASHLLAEIFEQAAKEVSDANEQVPLSAFQVINASNEVMAKAIDDTRMEILSFTGSDKVGMMLQQKAPGKKVILELGGNAAVIVHSDADLKRAAARCAFGAFSYAGQVCISVQRIFVQKSVSADFKKYLLEEVSKITVGDPAQKDTVVGPMIDEGNVKRILEWIAEAKNGGATILCGGKADGNVLQPTVLSGVKETHKLSCEEAFGPVAIVQDYDQFQEAIEAVNRSRFGLQAGVFTENIKHINAAIDDLNVGGILINEIPTFRSDNMPYGGMKQSGLGREGIRYTMKEYCELKTTIMWKK